MDSSNWGELPWVRETNNVTDRYAVAVTKDDVIVGYLPKKYSKIVSLFIKRGGSISCKVIGRRCYSRDLPQGGVEIPCKLILLGKSYDIKKNVNHRLRVLNLGGVYFTDWTMTCELD